jgi:ATP-binding cassette subfamily B protein
LLRGLCLNALIGTVFPAGVALAGRGLINSTSLSLNASSISGFHSLNAWLCLGAAMTLGMVATGSISRYLGESLIAEVNHRLQIDLLLQTQDKNYEELEDPVFHNTLRRAQEAAESKVANTILLSLELCGNGIKSISLMGILLIIEPTLFFLLIPVGIPYLRFQSRLTRHHFNELNTRVEKQRWIWSYTDLLSGGQEAAEVKVLGIAPLLIRRCQGLREVFLKIQRDYLRREFRGSLVFAGLSVLAIYIAMGRAAYTIIQGDLTIGDLAIYGSAATQLRALVEGSISQLARMRLQLLHVRNVREFLSETAAAATTPAPAPVHIQRRKCNKPTNSEAATIEFQDVCFQHRGCSRPVLDQLNLTINAGETVALVGSNGTGKTTIAKLIAGLYEPTAGRILLDGVDSRDLTEEDHRECVGCLFQHFGHYPSTAADNISFGSWQELLNQSAAIKQIARSAGVHDFIDAMPQGYDTVLGRNFGQFQPSGGQWQQLAIARTMARATPVLILDEPTASLDIESEHQIFMRFRELARGRTVLLISHRFATVRMADRILVLDKGKIVETGSHAELMRTGGAYAALVDLHQRHLLEC